MTPRRSPPLLLALLVSLAACAPSPAATGSDAAGDPESSEPPASQSAGASPSAEAVAYPLTLTDDAGREVTLDADPARIVSLAPSNTEIVCALDECAQLVGVTDFDDYPAAVADIDKVVNQAQVDVEAVVAAEPDLVIAAGNELTPTPVIEQLTELGLPVLTLYPETLDEIYADIELVGQALDRGNEASALVEDMEGRVAAVEDAVAGLERPGTFYEVSVFEGVIYTAGEGSFLASLLDIAGGEPITGDALSTAIELEDLVAADPEVILLGSATYDSTITPESVAARPGWESMTAVVDGRVHPVDDIVISRPGPRVVDGLDALAEAIHPEAFGG